MKRSRLLKLTLLSAAPLALAACRTDDDLVYSNVQDCTKDGRVNAVRCQQSYERARAEHLRNAERYAALAPCEDAYGPGACERTGDSLFMARMTGFVVEPPQRQRYGSGSSGWWQMALAYGAGALLGRSPSWGPQPIYRVPSGWNGGSWRDAPSERPSWGGSSRSSGRISTSTLSRGGFGGASAARSSWGG
jgi:uncharacterized protein YgiB involved in biofilm formation